jgi:mRNA (guanine-N7-)-methyltransferase
MKEILKENIISHLIYCIIQQGKINNFYLSFEKNVSNIDELRKFHNYIKKNILQIAIHNLNKKSNISLLDIACGRGGDIHKWINFNISKINGIDNHANSIIEAKRRLFQIQKNKQTKYNYFFHNFNILDPDILLKLNTKDNNQIYDIVSCQFALHYFCEDNSKLDHVLNIVSQKLSKNGLFIGTASDGDLIYNNLLEKNIIIPILNIIKNSNNSYLYYLNTNKSDKTINYFEVQGTSQEFFLFKQNLINLAAKNNLMLFNIRSFYDWYKQYDIKLSKYEQIISFFNFSFIFIKK